MKKICELVKYLWQCQKKVWEEHAPSFKETSYFGIFLITISTFVMAIVNMVFACVLLVFVTFGLIFAGIMEIMDRITPFMKKAFKLLRGKDKQILQGLGKLRKFRNKYRKNEDDPYKNVLSHNETEEEKARKAGV